MSTPEKPEAPLAESASDERGWWLVWSASSPLSEFELHSPWWVTGHSADEEQRISLAAAVLAPTEAAAWDRVRSAYDHPVEVEERTILPLGDQSPFTERFPRADHHAWDPKSGMTCECPKHDPRSGTTSRTAAGVAR